MAKLPKQVLHLLAKLSDPKVTTVKKSKKLRVGNLYLFLYDAKFKRILPYWDKLPLVILFGYSGSHMIGVNFHYLNWAQRISLLRKLGVRRKTGYKLKYKDILRAWKAAKLPQALMYLSIRKYLISHIRSDVKVWDEIDGDDWGEVAKIILPKFAKKGDSFVIRDIQRKFKENKGK